MLSGCIILIATTTTTINIIIIIIVIIIIIIIFIKQCVSWLSNFLVFFSSSSGLSESEYVATCFFIVPGLFTLIDSLMVLVSNASNLCLCSAKGGLRWCYVCTAILCIKYTWKKVEFDRLGELTLRKNSTLQKPCESPVTSCFQPCLHYFRAVNWL